MLMVTQKQMVIEGLSEVTGSTYRVVLLTGPPLNFLSTGSHVNWPRIFLSVSSYKGILYLKNLGGVQLKEPPCIFQINKIH